MALPNPGMDAVPFTPLTAEFLDDMIENIESLSSGTGFATGAITTSTLAESAVTASKIDFTTFSGTSTQWRTWTPTLSNHSGTVNVARYTLVGKTCQFYFKVTLTSGASASLNITLPVTASSNIKTGSYGFDLPTIIGHGSMVRNGDNYYALHAYLYNTTSINLGAFVVSGTSVTVGNTSATIPKTWTSGDNYIISGAYETA